MSRPAVMESGVNVDAQRDKCLRSLKALGDASGVERARTSFYNRYSPPLSYHRNILPRRMTNCLPQAGEATPLYGRRVPCAAVLLQWLARLGILIDDVQSP